MLEPCDYSCDDERDQESGYYDYAEQTQMWPWLDDEFIGDSE